MVDRAADLDPLPGIGPDLAGKIVEVVTTGNCALLERLRKELPPVITELLKIPGLGPKRVPRCTRSLTLRRWRSYASGRARARPVGPWLRREE